MHAPLLLLALLLAAQAALGGKELNCNGEELSTQVAGALSPC